MIEAKSNIISPIRTWHGLASLILSPKAWLSHRIDVATKPSGAGVTIDSAFKKAKELWAEIQPALHKIETEEDARFAIINRVLTEVLGWDHADVSNEPHTASGYTDYLLRANSERVFVIEAKRTGKILVDTVSEEMKAYAIDGPALKSASAGISQAAIAISTR